MKLQPVRDAERVFLPYDARLHDDGLWYFLNREYSALGLPFYGKHSAANGVKLCRVLTPEEAFAFSGRPFDCPVDNFRRNWQGKPVIHLNFFYDGNPPWLSAKDRSAYWKRLNAFLKLVVA